jgi:hypothetical protein
MDFIELVDEAAGQMPRERMVVLRDEKLTVFGDVHADLETFKLLEKNIVGKAVFLGDYADRGEYPVEVYTRVLDLFLEGKAILLRGNHENTGVYPHELPYQLRERFGSDAEDVYSALQRLWKKMPVSALIEGEAWLAHGGAPTKNCRIDEEGIEYGEIAKPDDYTMLEIMWNDPWEKEESGENYRRGVMYFFGKKATKHLLSALDVRVVIRSHEPKKVLRVEQDGMVVTIGSCALPYGIDEAALLKIDLGERFKNGYDLVRKFGYVFTII